ncbi:MAG TPA: hydrogenase expression/formation C-terminal domain-containing protein, partial [Burkholderiales bacterium]
MKPLNIPIVALGPGSQPMDMEDAPNLLDLPRDISGFVMPQVPETGDRASFETVRGVVRQLVTALSAHEAGSRPYPRLEMTALDAKAIQLLNQTLLDGEVSALLTGRRGTVKIQETNFPGVWRLLHYSTAGDLTRDFLEACPVPDAILEYAADAVTGNADFAPPPQGAINSPSVLHEIHAQAAAY